MHSTFSSVDPLTNALLKSTMPLPTFFSLSISDIHLYSDWFIPSFCHSTRLALTSPFPLFICRLTLTLESDFRISQSIKHTLWLLLSKVFRIGWSLTHFWTLHKQGHSGVTQDFGFHVGHAHTFLFLPLWVYDLDWVTLCQGPICLLFRKMMLSEKSNRWCVGRFNVKCNPLDEKKVQVTPSHRRMRKKKKITFGVQVRLFTKRYTIQKGYGAILQETWSALTRSVVSSKWHRSDNEEVSSRVLLALLQTDQDGPFLHHDGPWGQRCIPGVVRLGKVQNREW